MTFGFDTNLFIYSFDRTRPDKHDRARHLLDAVLDRITAVPMQVVSETLNAAHRKRHLNAPEARLACAALAAALDVEPAMPEDAIAASRLAEDHKLQFFDAQMVVIQSRLGTTLLLTEDMQDGRRFGTLQVVNPFDPANDGLLGSLLKPSS